MSLEFNPSQAVRPIANWSRPIEELGVLLIRDDEEPSARLALYAVLEGNLAALLTSAGGDTWHLAAVPPREQVVLAGRYAGRRLSFPADPERLLLRVRPVPQDLDPRRIRLVYAGDDTERLVHRRGRLLRGNWDEQVGPRPFNETEFFRAFRARFVEERAWPDMDFAAALTGPQHAAGKRPPDDPGAREATQSAAEYAYSTLRSLADGGRADARAGASIRVAISREGRYILVDGAHWLASALLLDLPLVPVDVVARHPAWERLRDQLIAYGGRHEGRFYQRVDHPDLFDIQAHHHDDRLPLIAAGLDGYDATGKRLVDIGAHWGQMSGAMERLGFRVTAIEADPSSARVAAQLRTATECQFDVWPGSVFEYPHIDEFDAVLALNIFHHFLKTKEMFDSLVAMLERLHAEILIFAAHVDRGPDMQTAYRNFPPDEFAQFVSRHSRLPEIKLLGHTHDGRSLFKLSANR